MKIEHVALWTTNLEQMKQFYVTYLVQRPMIYMKTKQKASILTFFRLKTEQDLKL